MSEALSPSAKRVQDALQALGLDCKVMELPDSTRTAREAAQAIGCQVEQIVKTLVFMGRHSGQPVLVIASGANRVNEKRLAALVGEPVAKADADFVYQQTGYHIGGVAPLGLARPMQTFVDEDLLQYAEIWAAAGTPHAVFRLTPDDLQQMTHGQVVNIR